MSNPNVNHQYQPPREGNGLDGGTTNGKVPQRIFAWIRWSGLVRGDDRWIGGVCSGIAARLGWSPTLVRALVIIFTLFFGFGAALYAFGWFFMPDVRDGRILAEELIAGRWDWNCLGCFVFIAVAILIPGAGWVSIVVAALALWWLAKSGIRQREGYGFGARGSRVKGAPTGPYPPYGFGADPTGPASPNVTPNGMPYAPAAPYGSPASYMQANPGVMPNVPSPAGAGYAPAAGPVAVGAALYPGAPRPMPQTGAMPPSQPQPYIQSAVRTPFSPQTAQSVPPYVSQGVSQSAAAAAPHQSKRRKPAGPIVVLSVLGISCLSFAALMGWIWFNDLGIESIIRLGTVWISAVCVLMGLVVVILGVKGRRTGGLIPLGLIAGFCAACMIMVSGTYSAYWYRYTLADRQNPLQNIELTHNASSENLYDMNEVQVGRTFAADSSDHTFKKLEQGVAFTGDSYEQSKAILDLSAWDDTHAPHQVKTHSGKTITTNCPAGTIKVAARSAQVHIILPDGCTYGFGSGQYGYMVGPASVGGKYALVYDTSGSFNFSLDGSSPFPTAPIGGKNYEWMANQPDLMPESGRPELLIAVPYTVEGRVNVVYASDWEDANFQEFADKYGTESGNLERQQYLDEDSDYSPWNQEPDNSGDASKEANND
ncbi:PspC domain-containing protein [Bifidobacterium cebidarum]|uniref:Phage shock protein C n=1 Tax=Bifidobacterium cebidarum TaxID=2650773 RepID=A0A6I1GIM4_9BIFI|nr:PspC domain-containing protein [Bifidobacterium cebidarum]KAB7789259.1 phage shock protein C [Bifidobacterium cebidarum]